MLIGEALSADGHPSKGYDPNRSLPFEQLTTDAAITGVDQMPRDASAGHADYPRSADNGLRTAGYNLAIIAAGLADDPKYPDLLVR
ncbi:MAG: hypothetical protein U5N53_09970 [Mycobacterium sp.]|nr:hypothetical protein [Mycobacterium sp.]